MNKDIQLEMFKYASGNMSEDELVIFFREKDQSDYLELFLNKENYAKIKLEVLDDDENSSILVQRLFFLLSKYLDIREFELYSMRQERQIEQVQKIIDVDNWLDGGISIFFASKDNSQNKIELNSYIEPINLLHLSYSLYYNNVIVPISSQLEIDIIDELIRFNKKKKYKSVSEIIRFVSSSEFKDNAKKIGRI